MKNIYLFVGRSGSGKTTLTEELVKAFPDAKILESYTTRKPRYENEAGHTFATVEDFERDTAAGTIVAWTKYNDNYYWATTELADNSDLYIIDVSGVDYFLNNYKGNKTPKIIYIDIDYDTSETRVTERFFKDTGLTMVTLDFTNPKINEAYHKEVAKRLAGDIAVFYNFDKKYPVDLKLNNNEGTDFKTIVDKTVEFIKKEEGMNG